MRERARLRAPIEPLARTAIPARHVVLDTEATLTESDSVQVQEWALGVTQRVDLSRAAGAQLGQLADWHDPEQLWRSIDTYCRRRSRVIVWAHNLAYDLRISRALDILPRLGWHLDGIMLEEGTAWAAFSQGERGILCCDLVSWLPTSLRTIARELGEQQQPIDFHAAGAEELLARCRQDVRITTRAVLELLEFIRREDLGTFKPTGAGQAFSAWRRRFHTHTVWVHNSEEALEAEREAIWPGRCEAWTHGEIIDGSLAEYDLELAHAHIAQECSLPVELLGAVRVRDYLEFERLAASKAILARCTVTTEVPVVPCLAGGRILWPVGTFDTVLWDPELRLAWQHGAQIEVHRAWAHRKQPALSAAARWIIDGVRRHGVEHSPLERRLLKHWSRTLVGRFALRYRRWEQDGTHPVLGLRSMLEWDDDAQVHRELLHIGHDVFELSDLDEAAVSAPAITGWVVAECRRRLWTLSKTAGAADVLYLDTDSILVRGGAQRRLERAIAAGKAHSLRLKGRHTRALIHGPRQVELDGERRFAGVPVAARETGPLEYAGEVWQSMRDSARSGQLTTVTVHPRTFKIRAVDRRREHTPDGHTRPFTIPEEVQQ